MEAVEVFYNVVNMEFNLEYDAKQMLLDYL